MNNVDLYNKLREQLLDTYLELSKEIQLWLTYEFTALAAFFLFILITLAIFQYRTEKRLKEISAKLDKKS